MRYIFYGISVVLGALVMLVCMCLAISAGEADRLMEEELLSGTENESQGKDRSEDDEGRSCAGEPEQ